MVSVRWRVLTAVNPSTRTVLILSIVSLLMGLLVYLPGLSAKLIGNTSITGPDEGRDNFYLLKPPHLMVVVKTDPPDWVRVHQGCDVQVEFA